MKQRMKNEQGAVLIISLIVLLVLTLIGVAGMNSSVMQERMASNAQNSNRVFQAAESSATALTELLISGDLSLLQQAMQRTSKLSDEGSIAIDSGNGISAEYQARYLGEIIVNAGSSMDADESTTLLKGYRFELRGSAEMLGTGAASTVFKGVEYY